MGFKSMKTLLNLVGSGYKLGRSTSQPSIQNFRKLKRCANTNSYHISAQRMKEIQEQINEGKTEPQKELLSTPLENKSLEDKKDVSNEVDGLKISGAVDLIAGSPMQKDAAKNGLPSKSGQESKTTVQEDVSKTMEKLEGEKIIGESQTKTTINNKTGKGIIGITMMDSIRREMKGSYSSIRQKQLDKNSSDFRLFGSKPLSKNKEKADTTREMNLKPFNSFDSIISNKVESIQPKENNEKQKTPIVEKGPTVKENTKNASEKEKNSQDNKVISIDDKKQIDKDEEKLLKEKSTTLNKETVGLGSESMNENNLITSNNNLKNSQSIGETSNVMEPENKELGNKASNPIDNKSLNSSSSQIKTTIYTGDKSRAKEDTTKTFEEDGPFSKIYMLNTLLDPIAKSSQKQIHYSPSQSGESVEVKAGNKAQKTDEEVSEGKQKVDKLIISGIEDIKEQTSTNLFLKKDTENNSKENTIPRGSDKLQSSKLGQLKSESSKTLSAIGRAKLKPKSLKVKYRLKEPLEDKIQKIEKPETLKKTALTEKLQKIEKPENLKETTTDKLQKTEKPENLKKNLTEKLQVEKSENLKETEKLQVEKSENLKETEKLQEIEKPENLKKITLTEKLQKIEEPDNFKETMTEKLQKSENLKETMLDKLQQLKKSESLKILNTKRQTSSDINKTSAVAQDKLDLQQNKSIEKEIQLHKEPHWALTKQNDFPKIGTGSQVAAIENTQTTSINKKPLKQSNVAIKQDFNDRGILAFDSSYIMKQLAKSRHSESIEEIPGPKIMRVCSNIVNALPVIGTLTISSLMRSYNRLCLSYGDKKLVSNKMKPLESLFNTHGDIVCLNIPLCGNVILVDKPELIHEVYRQRDMSQMMNSTFDSLNEVYNVIGKKKMRMDAINSIDEQMTCVIEHFDLKNLFWSANRYHDSLEKISDQLVERITFTRDMHNEVAKDFINDLNKWSLECMMQVLFATEIGSLKSVSFLGHHETDKVLKSLTDATDALRNCESGIQLWRVYETSSFTKLTESIKNLERFLCKHIPLLKQDTKLEKRLEMLQSNLESKQNSSSLISGLILSGYVDVDKLLKICMETMLIAVNTTSTSLGFILYHLARNQEKQKILHKELISVLPDKTSKLNPDVLQELPYLNGCVQETLRLKHPIPYSIMRLQRSIVLHKYYIPAGTWVMTANEVACLREENFEDAQLFKPERWLECSPELYQDTISPLLEAQFEPFLGRDWLQKQLLVGTAKIIRNFNVRYRYGEINKEGEFLSKPSKPFQFEFLEQHSMS